MQVEATFRLNGRCRHNDPPRRHVTKLKFHQKYQTKALHNHQRFLKLREPFSTIKEEISMIVN